MPRFTVITPTLLRPSLERACRSLDGQAFTDWQHIVMVDVAIDSTTEEQHKMLARIMDPRRSIRICDREHANFGNTCRHDAWDDAVGEYILYLDDDDAYSPEALEVLDAAIRALPEAPVWGTFPIRYLGEWYHKLPAGLGNTFCAQLFHRKKHDGWHLRFPAEREYYADGLFVEALKEQFPDAVVVTQPVVHVDATGGGAPRFTRVRIVD